MAAERRIAPSGPPRLKPPDLQYPGDLAESKGAPGRPDQDSGDQPEKRYSRGLFRMSVPDVPALRRAGKCFYGGAMVENIYPAVKWADAILLLCPNYNDALSANMTAFINRLTALFRTTRFLR